MTPAHAIALLALLSLTACSATETPGSQGNALQGPRYTRCGMDVSAFSNFEQVQLAENRAVFALGLYSDLKAPRVCDSLSGVKLTVEELAYPLKGEASCDNGTIKLNSYEFRSNSLAHEIAHHAEACAHNPDGDPVGEGGHQRWNERKVYAAIVLANSEEFRHPNMQSTIAEYIAKNVK